MRLLLFILLNLLTLTSYSQTTCFGTDQVPMFDVIKLQEKSSQIPLHKFHNKLNPNPQSVVKSVRLEKYSMNQGASEDINVNYFKNSENEDVSRYQYSNKTFYRVRNLKNNCTAVYELDSSLQELSLLASMPASSSDGFFVGGSEVSDYQDPSLAGAHGKQTEPCKTIKDGIKMFSVMTKTCGRVKFCEMESICQNSLQTEKHFCRAPENQCPDLEACKSDKSFAEIYKDFEQGTFRKENVPQTSAQ